MKKHTKKIMSSLAVLTLAVACGSGSGDGKKSDDSGEAAVTQREEVMVDGSNIQGFYLARFNTINNHIVGTIPGSASFTRKDDRLLIYLRLFAGSPKAWHMQAVYNGNRCPTMADDTNGDGTLDINEAMAVVGKVLIPLDSDPSTQAGGRNFYPLGDLSGSYHYERVVNFNRFLSDLQSEDKDPNDNIVKLGANTGLSFIGKVVMIQGVSEETQLPDTVGTLGRHRAFQTLPIACGVFDKVEATPGHPMEDEIPGPVADVEEGQDRPAPDDSNSTSGGSSSGSTTGSGTNDSDDGHGPVSDGEGGTIPGRTGSTTGSSGASSSTGGSTTGGNSESSSSSSGSSGASSSTGGSTTGGNSESSSSSSGSSGAPSSTGGETSSTTGDGSSRSTTTTTVSSSSSSTGE